MSSLQEQLNFQKAYREHRLRAAQWVLEHPETFSDLLAIGFETSNKEAHKAHWVLEFVCMERPELLYAHLDYFFEELPKVTQHSSVRPLSHLCERMMIAYYKDCETAIHRALSANHKTQLIECAFDWLITDQKVACQVRAMTCLYYLGTEFGWIHPELKAIIQQNIAAGSAGYKARGKKVLQQIAQFSSQS